MSVQAWIFAMRYLKSALTCSPTHSKYSSGKCLQVTEWAVIGVYTASIVGLWLWFILSYPGYVNDGTTDEFNNWLEFRFYRYMNNSTHFLWLIIELISCIVTIYAIHSIFNTVSQLATSRTELALNKMTLAAHGTLLTIQTLIVIVNTIPHKYIDEFYYRL